MLHVFGFITFGYDKILPQMASSLYKRCNEYGMSHQLREKSVSVEGNRSASETFRSIEEEVSRAALAAHFGKRKIWTLKKARAK